MRGVEQLHDEDRLGGRSGRRAPGAGRGIWSRGAAAGDLLRAHRPRRGPPRRRDVLLGAPSAVARGRDGRLRVRQDDGGAGPSRGPLAGSSATPTPFIPPPTSPRCPRAFPSTTPTARHGSPPPRPPPDRPGALPAEERPTPQPH